MPVGLEMFTWWYNWGLFLFLLLDLVAIFWIFLDTANRPVNTLAWRMGAIVPVLLVLPSYFFKFSSPDAQLGMLNLIEPFFWMGLLGGIIPIVLAIVYAVVVATKPRQPAAAGLPGPHAHGRAAPPGQAQGQRLVLCPVRAGRRA